MTDSDDAWLGWRKRRREDKLLRLVSIADDIDTVRAMIAEAPPDYPGLANLQAHLAELESRAATYDDPKPKPGEPNPELMRIAEEQIRRWQNVLDRLRDQ